MRYPLPLFCAFPPWRAFAKWRCDTPPQKGYLSDTCSIPDENKANGCDTPLCSGKEKAHKHKQIFPVTARVGGGFSRLPTGGQGSKVYGLCAEPKEHKHFRPGTRPGGIGFPAGRIGDRGDRESVYVPNVYVPFPAPICDTISKGYCAIWGGWVSRTGPLSLRSSTCPIMWASFQLSTFWELLICNSGASQN